MVSFFEKGLGSPSNISSMSLLLGFTRVHVSIMLETFSNRYPFFPVAGDLAINLHLLRVWFPDGFSLTELLQCFVLLPSFVHPFHLFECFVCRLFSLDPVLQGSRNSSKFVVCFLIHVQTSKFSSGVGRAGVDGVCNTYNFILVIVKVFNFIPQGRYRGQDKFSVKVIVCVIEWLPSFTIIIFSKPEKAKLLSSSAKVTTGRWSEVFIW